MLDSSFEPWVLIEFVEKGSTSFIVKDITPISLYGAEFSYFN